MSRAQGYGFDFNEYITRWNETSTFMIQVESIEAVNNIEELLAFEEIDAVMIGHDTSVIIKSTRSTKSPQGNFNICK